MRLTGADPGLLTGEGARSGLELLHIHAVLLKNGQIVGWRPWEKSPTGAPLDSLDLGKDLLNLLFVSPTDLKSIKKTSSIV